MKLRTQIHWAWWFYPWMAGLIFTCAVFRVVPKDGYIERMVTRAMRVRVLPDE